MKSAVIVFPGSNCDRDLGKVEEAYQEVARRLGILIDQGPGDVRGPTTLQ